jgi:hypothetical protein
VNRVDIRQKANQTNMLDEITTIDNLIGEHEAIKGHMLSISNLAEDWRGLEGKDLADLSPEQTELLNKRLLNMRQTMGYLEDGLQNHWSHEEQTLPDLIGIPIWKSIQIEHDGILKKIKEINLIIVKSNPREFLANHKLLMHAGSSLSKLIREHEVKENTVLLLLKEQFI